MLERGYSVVVISAYKLVELMRGYQFDGKGAEQVQDCLLYTSDKNAPTLTYEK